MNTLGGWNDINHYEGVAKAVGDCIIIAAFLSGIRTNPNLERSVVSITCPLTPRGFS